MLEKQLSNGNPKRANTMIGTKPPQLSNIERQRMKNNMKMTLQQKMDEEKKTGATTKALENQLEEAQKAEKTVKKDMANQQEQFQRRLQERKKNRLDRSASITNGGLNQTLPLEKIESLDYNKNTETGPKIQISSIQANRDGNSMLP